MLIALLILIVATIYARINEDWASFDGEYLEKFREEVENPNSAYNDTLSKIYGVNLGGWLLTEPWITPSLYDNMNRWFDVIPLDEYSLCLFFGPETCQLYLEPHWETFITDDDFRKIAELKLNLVRIPIGYWAFKLLDGDPYTQGQEEYLDLAIVWAREYGLKVQICLHGMPGSQNGFDNSGLTTQDPQWVDNDENFELGKVVINYIFDKYGKDPTVHSIEVVNEPLALKLDKTRLVDYYMYCLKLAKEKQLDAKVVLHDAFLNIESWQNFPGEFILDHHFYEVFTDWQINLDLEGHLQNVRHQGEIISQSGHRSIVGEFSAAMTDCVRYLNGIGKGTRWEGTYLSGHQGSCYGHDDPENVEFKQETMVFLKEAMYTYAEKGDGWIFWSWKTEYSLDWDMERLAGLNMLPVPLFKSNNDDDDDQDDQDDDDDSERENNSLKEADQNETGSDDESNLEEYTLDASLVQNSGKLGVNDYLGFASCVVFGIVFAYIWLDLI